ncbi:MAG: PEP-CTERM sorting domain-containing protein [Pseudomonadota bacterium]
MTPVTAQTSIYAVEAQSGASGGHDAAPGFTFAPNANNFFNVLSTGATNCCGLGGPLTFPADGADNGVGTNVTGINSLSSAVGNTVLPLLGVFIDSNTFNPLDTAPAILPWDATNPSSLAPLLNQVFYIGDGRAGLNDIAGTALSFQAPTNANTLYLGFADSFAFIGPPSFYADNPGSLDSAVTLNVRTPNPNQIPEPTTLALMGLGVTGLGFRRKAA